MYLVCIEGKAHGMFKSYSDAIKWAEIEWPVAYRQSLVKIYEYVHVR
jgi:hypothetical protein